MTSEKKQILGAQPSFDGMIEAVLLDIGDALRSGELAHGPQLRLFEEEFSRFIGTKYAAGVSSGGTALELVLKAIGVQGKEVVVPTDTFVATINAVILAGGKPVFCDTNPDTLALDFDFLQSVITNQTKAIIIVHMFGLVPPYHAEIRELCSSKGIKLIEDAAHAHGADYKGEMAGAISDAGCFSFYPTKTMTTGEGGMVTTNDRNLYDQILRLRNHGKSLTEQLFEVVSNNYRLAEIPAILGRHQLRALAGNIARRREIAARYREKLGKVTGLTLLPEFSRTTSSYWRFPAYLDRQIDRVALQEFCFAEYGVRITWMYEPACHLQPVFIKQLGHQVGDFPSSEDSLARLICLPCHLGVDDLDVERVIESVRMGIDHLSRKLS